MKKIEIIFENISESSYLLVRVLTFFNLKIYYLNLDSSIYNKKKLFDKLDKIKVKPLSLDNQKNLPHKIFYESTFDKDEILFKKNKILFSEEILEKFCKLYSIDNLKNIDLRLAVQDRLFSKTSEISTKIKLWSELNKDKKIIFLSFNLWTLYFIDKITNVKKIILPINFLEKKILNSSTYVKKKNQTKESNSNKKNSNPFNQKVALVIHKGVSANNNLYDKRLYYSDKQDSPFNKKNIVHLDYENYKKPNDDYLWFNLKEIKISKKTILFKLIKIISKTIINIRGWKSFLAWFLLVQQYTSYIIYLEKLNKFKQLKIAIIDYDHLCPKGLIFAFKKKNIQIISTQERFVGGLFKSFYNVIADTYFTCSDYMNKKIKNSKYFHVGNLIPVGQYRADYLKKFHNKNVPHEILIQREKGKKIIVALGLGLNQFPYFEPNFDMTINWKSQKNFIEDMLDLSKELENSYLIFRFRNFSWSNIEFFKSTLKKIEETPNVFIAQDYSEYFNSYRYCANADLIISKRTSLADECLAFGKKLIFYDYTHNLNKIISELPDYIPVRSKQIDDLDIYCHNYNEILEKSRLFLLDSSKELENYRKEINKIYFSNNTGTVKKKILDHLELKF